MEENVKKAVHYESFYRAAQLMSPKERLAFYDALDAYRFRGELLENLPKAAEKALHDAIQTIKEKERAI